MKRGIKLAVLALLAVALMGQAPAFAIESFGVGGRPANPDPKNPRTQSIFVYTLTPGQTIHDAIRVINANAETKTITVYPTDSQISSDGAFACEQAVDTKDDVGSWIKLDKDEVTLAGGKETKVDFTITVPTDGVDVGEHNGCIAIQDVTNKQAADKNGIALSFRSALRVAITIPGKVVTNLSLNSVTVANPKMKIMRVTPEYKNTGNVSLDTDIKVKLSGLFGLMNINSGGQFPILRDSTARFNFEINKPFWGGWYNLVVDTTYKQLTSSGDAATSALDTYKKTVFVLPQPLALLIEVLIAVLIIGGLWWWLSRRRRQKSLKRHSFEYVTRSGDDIQSIAARANVNWKTLAKLNGLKAPYALTPGTPLKIPVKKPPQTKGK